MGLATEPEASRPGIAWRPVTRREVANGPRKTQARQPEGACPTAVTTTCLTLAEVEATDLVLEVGPEAVVLLGTSTVDAVVRNLEVLPTVRRQAEGAARRLGRPTRP